MSQEPIKVLIADDQEISRLGLTTMLSLVNWISITGEAVNGQEAYRKCLSANPHVVVMDVGMPVMDGIEATQLIKKDMPDVKVVMLTTHDRDEDVFAALAAGADGYCLKNATSDDLYTAIKTVSGGGAWLDAGIADRVLKASVRSLAAKSSSAASPETATAAEFCRLSEREMEVLKLLVDGLGNQEMADRLFVSLETIKSHMRHIMDKLSVSDRTQAAVKALRDGIVK